VKLEKIDSYITVTVFSITLTKHWYCPLTSIQVIQSDVECRSPDFPFRVVLRFFFFNTNEQNDSKHPRLYTLVHPFNMTTSAYHQLVQSLTKEQILKKFDDIVPLNETTDTPSTANSTNSNEDKELFKGQDEEQIKLMEENCIVLDYNDVPIGAGTKKTCHLMANINQGLLHRAFSVFLFDHNEKLLLQQRADEKITFANMWTNTCCSHPLCVSSELGADTKVNEEWSLEKAVHGAKVAAQRKLDQELGIPAEDIPLKKFKFLTRIHYMSPSGGADSKWGEHEIDYILIIKANPRYTPNPNEVGDSKYVSKEELKEMFKDSSLVFTPWFKLICESYLFKWWDNLDNLDQFRNETIDRML